jgi:hypothetical protein
MSTGMNVEVNEFKFNSEYEGFNEFYREYSACNKLVMVSGSKENGVSTYVVYFWDMTDSEYIGSGYWACCDQGGAYSELTAATKEGQRVLHAKSSNQKI